jgi:hypothetical protein
VAALGGLGSLREEDQILHGSPRSERACVS